MELDSCAMGGKARFQHALLLWDFENVAPPKDLSLFHCVERIRKATGVHKGECRVFCNVKTGISDQRRQECQRAGLVVVDVPSRKPNASDMQIQLAMMRHVLALEKESRGVVVLISGDSDFAETGAVLREHNIEFVLVHNGQTNKHLRSVASRTYDFLQIVKALSCSICLKSFKTSMSLEQHRQSKHVEVPSIVKEVVAVKPKEFSCSHCGRFFQSEKSLVQHVNSLDVLRILHDAKDDEDKLKEAAAVLALKRKFGVHLVSPATMLREFRLQLMLDAFCLYNYVGIDLALWLIIDADDINFSGTSSHYQPECYRDEDYYDITPLIASCRNSDVVAVRSILETFPNVNVNATRSDGRAALHIACEHGNLEIVRLLLHHPAINVDMLEEKRVFWTGMEKVLSFPLHIAIRHGHVKVVRELMQRGFDSVLETPEGWRHIGIAIVCAFRNPESVAHCDILDAVLQVEVIETWTLMPCGDLQWWFQADSSVLMIPKCFCELEPLTMERCFSIGKEVKKKFIGDSFPVIFYALSQCSARFYGLSDDVENVRIAAAKALTKKILMASKVSFSPKIEGHPWERSFLFVAVESNDVDIVKMCLNFSETSRADSVGCSPLLVAAVNSNVEIVRLLLQNGAFLEVSNVRTFLGHCKQQKITAWVTVAMECFRRACSIENVTLGAQWTKKTLCVLEEAMDINSCVCF
jgi:ankyrin repeat protein/uncharacterized C2H2 Zn-finger protein